MFSVKPDLAVSERPHHHPRRDALRQQERGAGMTQVVEALARQASFSEERLEPPGDGDAVHRCPDRGREDEMARVCLPSRASQ